MDAAIRSKKLELLSLSLEELEHHVVGELKERPFRARQLYHWMHRRRAASFEEMTDLPKAFREKLAEGCLPPALLEKDMEQRSSDGTVKYRFSTWDGRKIESVYMPAEGRRTLCVSTQVGCAMGCTFCMTATLGLLRQLSAGEIVSQVHAVNREVASAQPELGERPLSNLVFMGMGEPLHNFENVKRALTLLQSEEGPNFSHRHITVSTVGLVPMIERLGKETDVKLAISLNATTDEQRSEMMPINKRWNIESLLEACRRFPMRQGRRITFEYVLLAGKNDSDDDALRLAQLLSGIPAKVNLIPYNENPGLGFLSSSERRAEEFRKILDDKHIAAFVRKNRGRDIAAACGQLANMPGAQGGDPASPPARNVE